MLSGKCARSVLTGYLPLQVPDLKTAQRKNLSDPSNLNSMNVIWLAVSSLGSNERGN